MDEFRQALHDIDEIIQTQDISKFNVQRIKEFLNYMIARHISHRPIQFKEIGDRKVIVIKEGKLSYNKDLTGLRIIITHREVNDNVSLKKL
jgi:hypothetical protein